MDRIVEWFQSLPPKQKVLLVGSALSLLLMTFLLLRPSGQSSGVAASFKDPITLVCQKPSCRNEFGTTPAEIKEYRVKHSGELFPCPKCGGTDLIQKGVKSRDRSAL